MANLAWSIVPSVDTGTTRTWTWENDISQTRGRHQADLRSDSPFTLRSDGSGHFKTYIDNDDTFELHLVLAFANGRTVRLPNALGGPGEYFSITTTNREFEFGWHGKELLFDIQRILIQQGR